MEGGSSTWQFRSSCSGDGSGTCTDSICVSQKMTRFFLHGHEPKLIRKDERSGGLDETTSMSLGQKNKTRTKHLTLRTKLHRAGKVGADRSWRSSSLGKCAGHKAFRKQVAHFPRAHDLSERPHFARSLHHRLSEGFYCTILDGWLNKQSLKLPRPQIHTWYFHSLRFAFDCGRICNIV